MRIRQIKPSWWLDKDLRRRLSAEAREFYIGLWMIADDAGWLDWDVERIAAELYPYDSVARRERFVRASADSLQALDAEHPHLVIRDCGHAQVPKMPGHQRNTGKVSMPVSERHKRCSVATVSHREPPEAAVGKEVGNGKRNGTEPVTVARAQGATDQERRELLDSFRRQGLPVEAVS